MDGGPYRQRLLSGSPHWRPPPTRFMYSSKHATGTHNKPLIKASFWSRFEKTEVANWSWICVCVCVRERERDRDRDRDRDTEHMRERASYTSKGKNFFSSVLDHISRVQCLVSTTNRFPETVYWMTVGRNLGGIFWYCEFPWYFFSHLGHVICITWDSSKHRTDTFIYQEIYYEESAYTTVGAGRAIPKFVGHQSWREDHKRSGAVYAWLKHLSTGDISSPCLCVCLSRESWPCF